MRTVFSKDIAPEPALCSDTPIIPDGVYRQKFDSMLTDLPRRHGLPEVDELIDAGGCGKLIVIEDEIKLSALRRHIEETVNTTPEIGINIIDNNVQLLSIGTSRSVPEFKGWATLLDFSKVDFHTHPSNAGEELQLIYPSLQDLQYLTFRRGLSVVGSRQGICEVPKLADVNCIDDVWGGYLVNVRGFTEQSYLECDWRPVFMDFMRQVVKPLCAPWESLDHDQWIGDLTTEKIAKSQ